MATWIKVLLLAILAMAVWKIIVTLIVLGTFAHYYKHSPGPCRHLDIQPGSEDFHTLPNGLTFISSGLRIYDFADTSQEFWRKTGVQGRVYLYDVRQVSGQVTDLKISSSPTFNADIFGPHGISVWEDKKTGRHVVYVVNHPYDKTNPEDRIEQFVYDPDKQELIHRATFTHHTMHRVNCVLATGENSFYFTNSAYFRHVAGNTLEILLMLPLTDVVHCSGQDSCSVMDSGLVGANGVVWSPDRRFLYVSEMQQVVVYRRHENNSLTRIQVYPLHYIPDNLEFDEKTGDLYVAIHPMGLKIMQHFDDVESQHTPSQVIQLQIQDGRITSAAQLFYDHGDFLSGASSAVVYNRTLLIGTMFHKFAVCPVNVPL